jgi:hypothetical protein
MEADNLSSAYLWVCKKWVTSIKYSELFITFCHVPSHILPSGCSDFLLPIIHSLLPFVGIPDPYSDQRATKPSIHGKVVAISWRPHHFSGHNSYMNIRILSSPWCFNWAGLHVTTKFTPSYSAAPASCGRPGSTHLPNYNLAIVAVVLLRLNLSAPPKTNPGTILSSSRRSTQN